VLAGVNVRIDQVFEALGAMNDTAAVERREIYAGIGTNGLTMGNGERVRSADRVTRNGI
jgi:hypothetical protein